MHLPVQSGSDRILAAMNRGYTARWYLDRVAALRSAVPGVSITTDLIAGFPGETQDDLAATLDLVQQAGFDAAFTFVFSARAGTAAATLDEQLPFEVKRDRVERLIAVDAGTRTRAPHATGRHRGRGARGGPQPPAGPLARSFAAERGGQLHRLGTTR